MTGPTACRLSSESSACQDLQSAFRNICLPGQPVCLLHHPLIRTSCPPSGSFAYPCQDLQSVFKILCLSGSPVCLQKICLLGPPVFLLNHLPVRTSCLSLNHLPFRTSVLCSESSAYQGLLSAFWIIWLFLSGPPVYLLNHLLVRVSSLSSESSACQDLQYVF